MRDLLCCVGCAVDGVGVSLLRFRLMRSRSATFRDTWSRGLLELSLLRMSHRLRPVSSVLRQFLPLMLPSWEFAVASVSEDVLDALEAESGGPACGSRGRGQSERFCGASAE